MADTGRQMHALEWRTITEPLSWSGWLPDNLRKEFSPATVIDVGAGIGTPVLFEPDKHDKVLRPYAAWSFYEAFPDST